MIHEAIKLCAHPESGLQFNLAVCSRALQQEALIQSHVGGVEEATEGQRQNAQGVFLLRFFQLNDKIYREKKNNNNVFISCG